MRIVCFAIAAILALASSAGAQDGQRYTLERTDQGYVRMDTETGEMSICQESSGQLVCRLAADERSAFQDEIDRLSGSLRTLEQRVTALEKAPVPPGLPSDEEFEKTMGYMERFFRGFMDIVKSFEEDEQPSATPQRT